MFHDTHHLEDKHRFGCNDSPHSPSPNTWLFAFNFFSLSPEKKKKKDIGISLEKHTNDSCKHNNTTDQ